MKKCILILLTYHLLAATDIPFDANLRVRSNDFKVTYSTRLNLVEFNSSKIITIYDQTYDIINNQRKNDSIWLKYIYYW